MSQKIGAYLTAHHSSVALPSEESHDATLHREHDLQRGAEWLRVAFAPHEFPAWQTVYHYFRRWGLDGTWDSQRVAEHVEQSDG